MSTDGRFRDLPLVPKVVSVVDANHPSPTTTNSTPHSTSFSLFSTNPRTHSSSPFTLSFCMTVTGGSTNGLTGDDEPWTSPFPVSRDYHRCGVLDVVQLCLYYHLGCPCTHLQSLDMNRMSVHYIFVNSQHQSWSRSQTDTFLGGEATAAGSPANPWSAFAALPLSCTEYKYTASNRAGNTTITDAVFSDPMAILVPVQIPILRSVYVHTRSHCTSISTYIQPR